MINAGTQERRNLSVLSKDRCERLSCIYNELLILFYDRDITLLWWSDGRPIDRYFWYALQTNLLIRSRLQLSQSYSKGVIVWKLEQLTIHDIIKQNFQIALA